MGKLVLVVGIVALAWSLAVVAIVEECPTNPDGSPENCTTCLSEHCIFISGGLASPWSCFCVPDLLYECQDSDCNPACDEGVDCENFDGDCFCNTCSDLMKTKLKGKLH